MKYVLVDTFWKQLLPITFTRPASHMYIGIDTISDKWTRHLRQNVTLCTAAHLRNIHPIESQPQQTLINSSVIPTEALAEAIRLLPEGKVLTCKGQFVAAHCAATDADVIYQKVAAGEPVSFTHFQKEEAYFNEHLTFINKLSDIFAENDTVLRNDFNELTKGFRSAQLPAGVLLKGDAIYVGKNAVLNHCVLNTTTGPIYIGEGAEIMEGAMIRGPFALGAHSVVKMGAKVYGATTIAPYCRVGGELNNVVMHPYSNKGHDGFLGNSVIGSWCNLGADTNTSNLKNNYGEVSVWNYASEAYEATGRLFHGLIMGDHSKAGINTMFNTGTVMGACANLFDGGFPPKFIPSFSWGTASGFETFKIEKAFEAAKAMMQRRDVAVTKDDEEVFRFIYEHDRHLRK